MHTDMFQPYLLCTERFWNSALSFEIAALNRDAMSFLVERVGDGKQILQTELCRTSSLASYLANYLFVLFLSSTSRSPLGLDDLWSIYRTCGSQIHQPRCIIGLTSEISCLLSKNRNALENLGKGEQTQSGKNGQPKDSLDWRQDRAKTTYRTGHEWESSKTYISTNLTFINHLDIKAPLFPEIQKSTKQNSTWSYPYSVSYPWHWSLSTDWPRQ